jgi:hypothetical protein
MKIKYDSVSEEYLYPISKSDIETLKTVVRKDIWSRIRGIRFGCNTKTTQEGRTVQHGMSYDIRINYCLNKGRSLALSDSKSYIDQIKRFGGVFSLDAGMITWSLSHARWYAIYLVLHEIGHIVFSIEYGNNQFSGRGSVSEEQWCDSYAYKKIMELRVKVPGI